MADPEKVLLCVLESKRLGKGSKDFKLKSRELPEESEALKLMNEQNIFKRENPSQKYHIVKRLAQGGFAKVFLVARNEDK